MFLEQWKKLRLQNQLLLLQILFVSVIFVILISACIYLVQLFSSFIRKELLQQLILNNVVSTIQTAIIRVDTIAVVVYNQFLAERYNLKLLFEFQVLNNISVYSQLDDCLQSPHSQQFYGYQFCYGLYGEEQNESDMTQILNFTALQNQFIPILQQKLVPTYYNIRFDKRVFLSQYQGQYLQQIDNQLLTAIQQMEDLQSTSYFKQQVNYTGDIFLQISSLNNSMYIGVLLNQSENPYIKLTQSEQYFNQRLITVLESGFMLSDTNYLSGFGMQFQNTSVTGFNYEQFQFIKNFADKKTLKNECDFQFKIQILCLVNINKKQQLVFAKYLEKSGFYTISIVEITFFKQIENDFNQQLESLIDNMFLNIGIQQVTALIICIVLQIAFIRKLNRPLDDLQCTAKSHINDYQHTLQKIALVQSTRNQTQKLAQAFYTLINLNNNNKNKQKQQFVYKKQQEFQQSKGTIIRRQSQKIIIQIRRLMQNGFWQVNQLNK